MWASCSPGRGGRGRSRESRHIPNGKLAQTNRRALARADLPTSPAAAVSLGVAPPLFLVLVLSCPRALSKDKRVFRAMATIIKYARGPGIQAMHSSSTGIITEDTRREGDAGDARYMQRRRIVSDYMLCLLCVHEEVVRFSLNGCSSR